MTPPRGEHGSVLVDTLVAIGVMSITAVIAARAMGDGAMRTAAGERSRLAALEARSRLSEVGGDIPLTQGRASGRDGDLVWVADVQPSSLSSGPTPLLEVTVTVSGANGKDLATLKSLRLGAPS